MAPAADRVAERCQRIGVPKRHLNARQQLQRADVIGDSASAAEAASAAAAGSWLSSSAASASSPSASHHAGCVTADGQDLARHQAIVTGAKTAGSYVAAVYRKKASGARADRPKLLRMVEDLQASKGVIAARIDRNNRLPLPEAELLVATIRG